MIDEKKIDIIKDSRPFKKLDVVVFVAVAIFLAVILIFVYSGGEVVSISYEGKSDYYQLNINREIEIEDKLVVAIKDGYVYVKSATCPDKVCVHSGTISRRNQMLVCAPYGVVISIISSDKASGGDGRWV